MVAVMESKYNTKINVELKVKAVVTKVCVYQYVYTPISK